MSLRFSAARMRVVLLGGLLVTTGGIYVVAHTRSAPPTVPPTRTAPAPPVHVRIDLDRSVNVALPAPKAALTPVAFKTVDGKEGWVVRLPEALPIATPAYADGRVYVGGGYGSHAFYAFDAQSGRKVWEIKTSDDGPSAAVVEDGCVAFNTESCTVVVADALTGHVLWQKWLGDPLMSQPAISRGKLYMAYPAGQRGAAGTNAFPPPSVPTQSVSPGPVPHTPPIAPGPDPLSNSSPPHSPATPGVHLETPPRAESNYRLLCADLRTGHPLWTQSITADVISAPVIDGDQVFLTCFDGNSYCLNATTGAIVWRKQNSGTSAPVVANGQVVMTLKESRDGHDFEGIQRMDVDKGQAADAQPLAMSRAEYFKNGKGVSLNVHQQAALDSSVGFGGGSASAEMAKSSSNVGVSTVAGGWAYQGSKAAYHKGRIMNAQGNALNSLSEKEGKLQWQAEATGRRVSAESQVFSPPALGTRNMYLCTAQGHLLAVGQQDGRVGFQYATGQPMAFQPALAEGNMYVGTSNGLLICLKTGDKDADGWTAWGGNAQHNKKD